MIAVDANILVYAHRQDSAFHAAAKKCVADLANGTTPWVIPWPCIYEFYAVVTHPRIYRPASSHAHAIAQIDAWLGSPTLTIIAEGITHWTALRDMLQHTRVVGPLVHDARVASLCLENRVTELWSADRDFGRFRKLRVKNPLVL